MLFSVPADLPASHMASKGVDAFPLSQLLFRSAGLVLIPFSLFPPPASFFSPFYSTQVWRGFFALFGRSLRTSASIQYMLCENHSTRKFFFFIYLWEVSSMSLSSAILILAVHVHFQHILFL